MCDTYPGLFLDKYSVRALAINIFESPDITQLESTLFNEGFHFHLCRLSSRCTHNCLLLLAPKLLEFTLFEVVEVTRLTLLSGILRLAQPSRVVAAVL
jgi:hypothetical protein